ncbi:MAG: hypothetical protein ACD_73C00791G0001 [uncultured bacterium]|nr:MAG: hypothetical protein ACD_73C00791G0001 [uncultured bacterium]
MPQKLNPQEAALLIKDTDELTFPLATGQPGELLQQLSTRSNWKDLKIFTGLLTFPFPLFTQKGVSVTSGYYGPIERYLNKEGFLMEYLPSSFTGFETYALRKKFRVIATTLSPADADGYHTFGTHGAAIYKPFVEACKNPDQITIAEINNNMPLVYGTKEFGDNKIHHDALNYFIESNQSSLEPQIPEINETEKRIAENVVNLIQDKATLQLGIGTIPNYVAELLAKSSLGDFGVHSELISDGFIKLFEAGKISNRHKGIFDGSSIFTFALGSKNLYDLLDERNGKNKRQVLCLPVSVVNNPHYIAQNRNFVSINSGLTIDFAGQVCSEAIGLKQYSGVGGQLSFVQGAFDAIDGKSILCIKSTATVKGQLVSNIVPTLPQGSLVSTPRHYVQYIVTEYGTANLYGVSDEERAQKLIPLAHPQFREELSQAYENIQKEYYKTKS